MSILSQLVDDAKKKKDQLEQMITGHAAQAPAPVVAHPATFIPYKNPVQAAATVPVAPTIRPVAPTINTSPLASINRVGTQWGLGGVRALAGDVQDLSGISDLVGNKINHTNGMTSRFSKGMENFNKGADQAHAAEIAASGYAPGSAGARVLDAAYHGGQISTGGMTMVIPGAGAEVTGAKIAEKVPMLAKFARTAVPVTQGINRAADSLEGGNAASRVAATALRTLHPSNIVGAGANTAMTLGGEASKGHTVTPGDVAMAAGGNMLFNTGLPVLGKSVAEGARAVKPLVRPAIHAATDAGQAGAKSAAKYLNDISTTMLNLKPNRDIPDEVLDAASRVRTAQTMGDTTELNPHDYDLYKQLRQHIGGNINDPKIMDGMIRDRRVWADEGRKKLEMERKAIAKAQNSGEGGFLRVPGGSRDPAPDLRPDQKEFINEYANMIEGMDKETSGGQLVPDGEGGKIRTSSNSPFYRQVYADKGRPPNKADYFDEARRQIETGKAAYDAHDDYKLLDQPQPTARPAATAVTAPPAVSITPEAAPVPIQDLLAAKQAQLADRAANVPESAGPAARPEAQPNLQPADTPQMPNVADDPNTDISRFPARLLEDDRTEPLHKQLLQQVTHEVKHNKDTLAETAPLIGQDENKALDLAKHGSSTEANATAMQLLNKYLNEGQFDKADDLLKVINPRFTRQGQETQILAAWSKLTPAGAVKYAARQVEKASEKSANGKKLENAVSDTHKQIQGQAKDIAKQLEGEVKAGQLGTAEAPGGKKSPEQMLADRIKASEKKPPAKDDPVRDMVNTLHQVAKQVLPDAEKSVPRDPMVLVGRAVKDEAGYRDIYDKAKDIVRDKYKDNPEAQAELDKYFSNDPSRTYADKQLDKGIQSGLKDTDLSKLVRDHYSKVDEAGQTLSDKLIERAGLDPAEAGQLAGDIQKRYKQLVQDRKDTILKTMFGDRPTPAQKTKLDKLLEMNNLGALSRDDLRGHVADRLGLPSLSKDAAKQISQMANRIQELPEGIGRNRAVIEMMRYIKHQIPTGLADGFTSVWKGGLLSGQKTFQGNIISIGGFGTMKKASDVFAVGADSLMSYFGAGGKSQRTKSLTLRGLPSGTASGVKSAFKTMKTGIDERDVINGKYEVHAELNFKNPVIQKVLGMPSNMVFRTMSAADQPFALAAARNSLYDQAISQAKNRNLRGSERSAFITNLVKNPTVAMAEVAKRDADKAILGFDTVGSKAIENIHTTIDKFDGMSPAGRTAMHTVVSVLAPFVKVPTAFISRTIDFTPAGPFKQAIRQISNKQFDQRALSEAIGEGITGTGVIALGIALAAQGKLSGDYPKNDPKEAGRWQTDGTTPNSIKLYNPVKKKEQWYSLNYLGPVGLLFNAGKQFHDGNGEGFVAQASKAVGGVGQALLGQSFLQGFSGFSDAIKDPQRNAKSFVNSQASSTVPAWLNDIANVTDRYQRQADTATESIKNRIPGLREQNKVKEDVYGNKLEQASGQGDTLNALKPSDSLTGKSDAVAEASRLHNVDPSNQDLQVTPNKIGKTVDVEGKQVPLNKDQQYALQEKVGQATQDQWNKLIKTKEYQALSDSEKAKALNRLRQANQEYVTRGYVEDNGLGSYSKPLGADALRVKTDGNIASFTRNASADDYATQYDDAVAQFKEDSSTWSAVTKSKKQRDIDQLAIKKDYDKDIVDLYGMNKQQVYDLVSTEANGSDMAKKLVEYGDKLEAAGLGNNKFRNAKGVVNIRPKDTTTGSGSSAASNSLKLASAFATPYDSLIKSSTAGSKLARAAGLAKKKTA